MLVAPAFLGNEAHHGKLSQLHLRVEMKLAPVQRHYCRGSSSSSVLQQMLQRSLHTYKAGRHCCVHLARPQRQNCSVTKCWMVLLMSLLQVGRPARAHQQHTRPPAPLETIALLSDSSTNTQMHLALLLACSARPQWGHRAQAGASLCTIRGGVIPPIAGVEHTAEATVMRTVCRMHTTHYTLHTAYYTLHTTHCAALPATTTHD